jgi:hypothetical protein
VGRSRTDKAEPPSPKLLDRSGIIEAGTKDLLRFIEAYKALNGEKDEQYRTSILN